MLDKIHNDSTSFEDSIRYDYFGFAVRTKYNYRSCRHVKEEDKKEIFIEIKYFQHLSHEHNKKCTKRPNINHFTNLF